MDIDAQTPEHKLARLTTQTNTVHYISTVAYTSATSLHTIVLRQT
jgi:hypothetical protein